MELQVNTLRLALTTALKAVLSGVDFRGKGRMLSSLCPKDRSIGTSVHGYKVTLDLREHIQRTIFLTNYDERAVSFVRSHLKRGNTFVDIGANIGFYSLLASRIVGNGGRVFAIEPHPKTFAKLCEIVQTNQIRNIIPVNVALGAEPGHAMLFSDSTLGNDSATLLGKGAPDSAEVEVDSLDRLVSRYGIDHIHYLKIDVDGYEPTVFAGATDLLTEGRVDAVQSEFCDYWLRRNGSDPKSLHNLLVRSGFVDADGDPVFGRNCIVDRFLVAKRLVHAGGT